jgi:cytochrome c oxidase subunit 1
MLATIGAFVMGIAVIVFVTNVFYSIRRGPVAGDNPWGADTLEWLTTSPPPSYNYQNIPVVRGRHALWELEDDTPVVTGLHTRIRESLCTTLHDAVPEHRYSINGPSIFPLLLSLVTAGTFISFMFTPWSIPIGMFCAFLVLLGWFWSNSVEHREPYSPEEDNPTYGQEEDE